MNGKRFSVVGAFLICLAALAAGGIALSGASGPAQQEVPRTRDGARKDLAECGTLDCFAKRAKEKGQKEIYVPTPLEAPPAVGGWDDALARFTVVVAELVEKKSYVESSHNLVTWHKFKVIEYLSRADPDCPTCLSGSKPPDDLLPLEADEILIAWTGGTMSFDGVRVVNRPADFPEEFLNSQKYLLVLSLLPAKGVGVVAPGPLGAFKLKAEKDRLEPMSTQPRSALKVELDGRLGNSLRQLKAAAQKRKNFSHD